MNKRRVSAGKFERSYICLSSESQYATDCTMPRKRRTQVATWAKPVLPAGDDDADITEEARKEQLAAYLKDFDIQVELRIKEMRDTANTICRNIKRSVKMYSMTLSKETKNMKVIDYFAQNAITAPEKLLEEISKTVSEIVTETLPADTVAVISSSGAEDTASSSQESDTECSEAASAARPTRGKRSTRKGTTARKKTTTSTAKRASARTRARAALQETPASFGNEKNKAFQTPANTVSMSALSTPFITPKFDPTSKMTPATMRRAKKGELLVSLSGSPVEARNSPREPIQSVEKLKENVENFFAQDAVLDDVQRKNILMLQETLNRYLKESS